MTDIVANAPGPLRVRTGLRGIGKALDEATVFQVASALEYAGGFVTRPETWW